MGFAEVGLFYRDSWSFMGVSMDYSSYLSVGFWLALVAAILAFLAFISLLKHPVAPPPALPVSAPAPES
jgi:hypothetical protein